MQMEPHNGGTELRTPSQTQGRFQAGGIIQAPARRAGPRPLRSTTRRREPGRTRSSPAGSPAGPRSVAPRRLKPKERWEGRSQGPSPVLFVKSRKEVSCYTPHLSMLTTEAHLTNASCFPPKCATQHNGVRRFSTGGVTSC